MSCLKTASCTFVAGELDGSLWVALPFAVVLLIAIQNIVFGVSVGQARKKYKVFYPAMYAYKGQVYPESLNDKKEDLKPISEEDAFKYNCIQRGHQNYLENLPTFFALLFVGAFTFPLYAGVCGLIWWFGKFFYFYGYGMFFACI
jgi:glutathione S-transferase